MCPLCMASAGLIVGSVVSTGGLAAVVVKILRKDKQKTTNDDFKAKEQ
jgi:hypothetical protein